MRPGGAGWADRSGVPQADGSRERHEQSDVRRIPTEPCREFLDERLRRADVRSNLAAWLTCGEGQADGERTGILREAGATGRVISIDREGLDLAPPLLACLVRDSSDDACDLGWDDVAVRVNGHQEPASLQRETDAASGLRRPLGGSQTQRLAFELEQLVGLDFTAFVLDPFENTPFGWGKLRDFFGETLGVAQKLPGRFERKGDGRRGGSSKVVCGHRARRFERCLREQCAKTTGILAFPRAKLHEVRDGQNELDGALFAPGKHHSACRKRFESRGYGRDEEDAVRFGDTVQELDARCGQAARIAEIRKLNERARDLRRYIQTFCRVDAHPEPRDQRVQLGLWQCPQNVGQPQW